MGSVVASGRPSQSAAVGRPQRRARRCGGEGVGRSVKLDERMVKLLGGGRRPGPAHGGIVTLPGSNELLGGGCRADLAARGAWARRDVARLATWRRHPDSEDLGRDRLPLASTKAMRSLMAQVLSAQTRVALTAAEERRVTQQRPCTAPVAAGPRLAYTPNRTLKCKGRALVARVASSSRAPCRRRHPIVSPGRGEGCSPRLPVSHDLDGRRVVGFRTYDERVSPTGRPLGPQTSRTMMLAEVRRLLRKPLLNPESCLPRSGPKTRICSVRPRPAVGNGHFLPSASFTRSTLAMPRSASSALLWGQDPAGRPPMALLQVLRRNRLLLATAATILAKPEGAPLSATELSAAFMPLQCRARSNGPGGGTLGVPSCRVHVGSCRPARSRMNRDPAYVAKMVPTELPAGTALLAG